MGGIPAYGGGLELDDLKGPFHPKPFCGSRNVGALTTFTIEDRLSCSKESQTVGLACFCMRKEDKENFHTNVIFRVLFSIKKINYQEKKETEAHNSYLQSLSVKNIYSISSTKLTISMFSKIGWVLINK